MSRARHKKAKGGGMYYSGSESNVAKEAAEKKYGGKSCKKGGKVKHMKAEGSKAKSHLGKMKRATGGRTMGSDKAPFSSAHKSVGSEKD